MTNVLELKDVSKTYYLGELEVPVLHNIDLHIKQGEFISIVGHSGSGKSTLLNLIGLLDTPTNGQILLSGKDVSKMDETQLAKVRREKIGFVFQKYNLIAKLTALENVSFPLWLRGIPSEDRVKEAKKLLKIVGRGQLVFVFRRVVTAVIKTLAVGSPGGAGELDPLEMIRQVAPGRHIADFPLSPVGTRGRQFVGH